MIKNVYSVAVVVSDEKKAMKWYKDVLGFRVVDKYEGWVTVKPTGSKTLLHLCEQKRLEPGNTGINFEVNDVDKTYEELSKRGIRFTKKPRDDGWGKYARFKDSDGNEFWLTG